VGAGAGFLLAVLWIDLMWDVQVRRHRRGDVPAEIRASIATYYARVTTGARPMNRLIAATMLVTLGALIAEIVREELPVWRSSVSLLLTVAAVGLAAVRTVRNAVRLGRQTDDPARQSTLARIILRDHVFCLACIATVLVLQLAPA
jgi:hypothetical protein